MWKKLLLCLILCLFACGTAGAMEHYKLLHPWSEYQQQSYFEKGTGTELLQFEHQYLQLTDEDARLYPELARALARDNARDKKADAKLYASLVKEAKDMRRERREDGTDWWAPFEDTLRVHLHRADSECLSVRRDYIGYRGGVHGYYSCSFRNYNPATGREYNLEDLVLDKEAFAKEILIKLAKGYPGQHFALDKQTLLQDYMRDGDWKLNWGLGYNGLTIVFNPYEIASYAEGMQVVALGYNECGNFIKTEFISGTPHAYTQYMPVYTAACTYMNRYKEGMLERLSVDSYYEDSQLQGLKLTVDDQEYRFPLSAAELEDLKQLEPYFVCDAPLKWRLLVLGADTVADTRACFSFRLQQLEPPIYEGEQHIAVSGERHWLYSDPAQLEPVELP